MPPQAAPGGPAPGEARPPQTPPPALGSCFKHRPAFHASVDPGNCRTIFDCHRSITKHFRESKKGGGVEERNYYLDTAHLLFDYYQQSSADGGGQGPDRKGAEAAPARGSNVRRQRRRGASKKPGKMLSFLRKMATKQQQRRRQARPPQPPAAAAAAAASPRGVPTGSSPSSPPTATACDPNLGLSDIIEKYNQCVDPVATVPAVSAQNDPFQVCVNCDAEGCCVLMEADSTVQCTNCGTCTYSPMLHSVPSYQMASRTARPTFTLYKRANHFNEWISQFQAKESISVPDEVYAAIVRELAKRGPQWRTRKITSGALRVLLRKLKFNKYYEHIPRIIHRLQGTPPPTISREVEEKLRRMFRRIQEPFMRHSPPSRRNFLQYSYVLHKFMGILGLRDLQKSFPLLKSRSKSYAQDLIWKKICKDVGFPYEPSI
jgi:hypothetical protein